MPLVELVQQVLEAPVWVITEVTQVILAHLVLQAVMEFIQGVQVVARVLAMALELLELQVQVKPQRLTEQTATQ
jgi:hypothetical protein